MPKSNLQITAIGHATTLIKMGEQNFLTDPIFSNRIFFRKRLQKPGLETKSIPPLSAILISNAHYDHLDLFSFKFFKSTIPVIVPKGLEKFVGRFLPNAIIEIPPWSHHLHQGVEIHAIPIHHFGYRWFPVRHRPSTAYLLRSSEGSVYFTGATGYGKHFKEAGNLYPIDVALLPIAGYNPPWLHKKNNMNPEEALKAIEDLQAQHFIPIGWGTFSNLGEKPEEAKDWLGRLVGEKKLSSMVKLLSSGDHWSLES
jgi:L-ascorbate metabolism protein UlaG (beta-lactamase superfamily)